MKIPSFYYALIALVLAHVGSCDSVSGLYDISDNVTILTAANFNETIFNSPCIWIVEFYSSWCGHCQEFAPTFKAFGKDIVEWQGVIQTAVVNCPDDINRDLCRRMAITGYPEMRVFPPFSNDTNPGQRIEGDTRTIAKLREVAIDSVEKYMDHVKWNLEGIKKPIFNYATYQDLLNFFLSVKGVYYFALIIETESSTVGEEIILDMSSCKNITTRRINSGSVEMTKMKDHTGLELDDLPTVLVFMKSGGFKEIIVKLKQRSFYSYKLRNLPGVGDPKLLPKQSSLVGSKSLPSSVDWTEVDRNKVYMADIESGLRYALTVEVASVKVLKGRTLEGLKTFLGTLAVLSERMPIQQSTRKFLGKSVAWLAGLEEIVYETWRQRIEENEPGSALPLSDQRWVGCAPSEPGLRGYPCSLWTLFHAMTVASYRSNEDDQNMVPLAMEAYITNFFGCMECRKNFIKELTESPYKTKVKSGRDLVLWLWRLHNKVNKRLHGAVSEDPNILKVQFPPPDICGDCRDASGDWNEENVLTFLLNFYGADKVSTEYLVKKSNPEKKHPNNFDDSLLPPHHGHGMQMVSDEDFMADTDIQARVEFENDFDAGESDEAFEKAGKKLHGRLGHPVLVNELLQDRVKEHQIDVLEEFGGYRGHFHPRDLGARSWHGDRYQARLTGFDTSLCVLLWSLSMVAVGVLYCYIRRRRMSKYCRV